MSLLQSGGFIAPSSDNSYPRHVQSHAALPAASGRRRGYGRPVCLRAELVGGFQYEVPASIRPGNDEKPGDVLKEFDG